MSFSDDEKNLIIQALRDSRRIKLTSLLKKANINVEINDKVLNDIVEIIEDYKNNILKEQNNKEKYQKELKYSKEERENIYELRKKGYKYMAISERYGCALSTSMRIWNEMFILNRSKEEDFSSLKNEKEIAQKIFELRNLGISIEQIVFLLNQSGIIMSKEETQEVYLNYRRKKIVENEENDKLARMIMNLIKTKHATLEQVKIIADYYGVDLEKVINQINIEER